MQKSEFAWDDKLQRQIGVCVGVLFLQFKEMPLCVGSLVLRVVRRGDIEGDATPCCEPGKKGSENTPVSECDCSTSAGSLLLSQVKSSTHRVVVEVGGGQLAKRKRDRMGHGWMGREGHSGTVSVGYMKAGCNYTLKKIT